MENQKTQANKLIKQGVWTPGAQVICIPCHGNDFPKGVMSDEEWAEEIKPKPFNEKNGVTTCDICGCDIQLDSSIAGEKEILKKLRQAGIEAHMWHTGGWCSAVGIPMKLQKEDEEGYYCMVTYNSNGDKEYTVGYYENDNDYNEHLSFSTLSEEEVLENILQKKDLFCEWKEK